MLVQKVTILSDFRKRRDRDKRNSVETSIFKGLTDESVRTLIERFSSPKTEAEYRNRALLSLMLMTGMRAAEIVSLRFSKLLKAPTNETIISYIKKGGRVAYSVLPDETLNFIREYHAHINIESDYFFLSMPMRNQNNRSNLRTRGLQKIVNSWGEKTCAGKLIHPHSIRHTSCTKMLEKAGTLAAQRLLNHTSLSSTIKYTKQYIDGSKYLTWE
ncbi:site-specific integrase [Leptospira santarosai]|uniref:tyrosine-type recombinase/integrase n=1 Tax=Leptospira santarosai TaxID=28183 RepID=UPI0022A8DFD4|nr:tyrosine-type recombinase/integrase [Leptospira santarosai]UZN08735.1 site-specific integrase [Leptospira santarosai]